MVEKTKTTQPRLPQRSVFCSFRFPFLHCQNIRQYKKGTNKNHFGGVLSGYPPYICRLTGTVPSPLCPTGGGGDCRAEGPLAAGLCSVPVALL